MKKLKIAFFGGTFANLEIYNKCKLLGAECYLLDKNKMYSRYEYCFNYVKIKTTNMFDDMHDVVHIDENGIT